MNVVEALGLGRGRRLAPARGGRVDGFAIIGMVLIAILLIAALMVLGLNNAGMSGSANRQQASLHATGLMEQAQAIRDGFTSMDLFGDGPSDVRLNASDRGVSPNTGNQVGLYSANHGALSGEPRPIGAGMVDDAARWAYAVDASGNPTVTVTDVGTSLADYVVYLTGVELGVCQAINTHLHEDDQGTVPPTGINLAGGGTLSGTRIDGRRHGCIQAGTDFQFYAVVRAR